MPTCACRSTYVWHSQWGGDEDRDISGQSPCILIVLSCNETYNIGHGMRGVIP